MTRVRTFSLLLVASVVAVLAGCSPADDHAHTDGHHHETDGHDHK